MTRGGGGSITGQGVRPAMRVMDRHRSCPHVAPGDVTEQRWSRADGVVRMESSGWSQADGVERMESSGVQLSGVQLGGVW